MLGAALREGTGPPSAVDGVPRSSLTHEHATGCAVDATFGYRERPDLLRVLARARERDPVRLGDLDPDTAVFFVSVPIPMLTRHGGMARWRQRVFLLIDRLATDPVEQLRLPRDRTVVLGREPTL